MNKKKYYIKSLTWKKKIWNVAKASNLNKIIKKRKLKINIKKMQQKKNKM